MDKLEKYIVENRPNFDEPRHPEKGWRSIESRLRRKSDFTIYWKVAAVLFFASTVVLLVFDFDSSPSEQRNIAEVDRFEDFYVNQINLKMKEYGAMVSESEKEDLFADLEVFDSAYTELSRSFDKMRDQEIAEAMLENLRLRILILTEQIEIVKRGGEQPEAYHSS